MEKTQNSVLSRLPTDLLMNHVAGPEYFQSLLERIPELLFAAAPSGLIEYCNDYWQKYTGLTPEKMLGLGYLELLHPDDRAAFDVSWRFAETANTEHICDVRLRRHDGVYQWHRFHCTSHTTNEDKLVRWYGCAINIDEQRRAIDALDVLAESGISAAVFTDKVETLLNRIANAALTGLADIAIFDFYDVQSQPRRIVVRSPHIEKLVASEAERYSTSTASPSHPVAQAMSTRTTVYCPFIDDAYIDKNVEPEARRKSWRTIGVRSMIATPLLAGERLLGSLTLVRTDASEAFERSDVRIVEEIARRSVIAMENIRLGEAARTAALERDEQFQRIADAMPQLMWITDRIGNLEWVNKRWLDFAGVSLEEALQNGWSSVIYPEDTEEVKAAWEIARQQNTAFECEFRMVNRSGVQRWFLARATPVATVSGMQWYGTNTDIDEARRAARTARVFADVGEALSESLGLQDTLDAIMETVVPEFADWAYVTLTNDAGDFSLAAIYHCDSRISSELRSRVGAQFAVGDHRKAALRVRTAYVFDTAIESPQNHSAERSFLQSIQPIATFQSAVSVPLFIGPSVRGCLTLLMDQSQRQFTANDLPFFTELGRRISPAIANAKVYERERRVAQSFQQAALPPTLPEAHGYVFSAVYEAGQAEALVGGDWYDAFKLLDGRIIVSIGDVAGSGLRAAVTMANIRQAIRGVAHVNADPELMLEAADRALRSETEDFFATAFVGVIDPVARSISYKSAGHPPAILAQADGELIELRTEGLPLGLRAPDRSAALTRTLADGAMLVLYTDGLVESTRDFAEGERRLFAGIARCKAVQASQRAETLYREVLRDGSRDDVAILTISIVPSVQPYRWTFHPLDSTAAASVRAAIMAELRAHRQSAEAGVASELILAELIGNLARYAPEEAEIVLEWDHGRPILHVLDIGPGFEFLPKLPIDVFSETGRGLFLISALSEEFNVTRRPEGGSHARVLLTL
jgi:PAS domain S-box-containing protein